MNISASDLMTLQAYSLRRPEPRPAARRGSYPLGGTGRRPWGAP